MNNLRRLLTVAGLGAGIAASAAFGSTLQQTFTVNTGTPQATEISTATSNHVFNFFGSTGASLGQTLTGVTIEFIGDIAINNFSVTNGLGTTQGYAYNAQGEIGLTTVANFGGNGAAAIGSDVALVNAAIPAASSLTNIFSVGTTGFAGCQQSIASSATDTYFTNETANSPGPTLTGFGGCGTPAESGTGKLNVDSGAVAVTVADFTGSGTFDLSYGTFTQGTFSNTNLNAGVVATYDSVGRYIVTYTYTPSGAPEPTTMFLLGSGLVGLGFLRRRATKR
jgi:hypothetical protein